MRTSAFRNRWILAVTTVGLFLLLLAAGCGSGTGTSPNDEAVRLTEREARRAGIRVNSVDCGPGPPGLIYCIVFGPTETSEGDIVGTVSWQVEENHVVPPPYRRFFDPWALPTK